MIHPLVERLINECPFLESYLDKECLDLPTVAFGAVARHLIDRRFTPADEVQVFDSFNKLAATGNEYELDVLGTGAIELFNDSAEAQRLARANLKDRALTMLEEFRSSWGQADYESAS